MTEKRHAQFELPERGPDEPDATERQIGYIKHLLYEIGAEELAIDIASLGKWQASTLISRLKTLQDGVDDSRISVKPLDNSSRSSLKVIFWIVLLLLVLLFIAIVQSGCLQ